MKKGRYAKYEKTPGLPKVMTRTFRYIRKDDSHYIGESMYGLDLGQITYHRNHDYIKSLKGREYMGPHIERKRYQNLLGFKMPREE